MHASTGHRLGEPFGAAPSRQAQQAAAPIRAEVRINPTLKRPQYLQGWGGLLRGSYLTDARRDPANRLSEP